MSLGTLPFVQTICGSLSFPLLASSAQALAPNHPPCCQDRQAQHSCQQPRVSWFLGNNIIAVALFPKGSDACHKHNPNQNLREEKQRQTLAGMRFEALVPPWFVSQWGNLEKLLRPPKGVLSIMRNLCTIHILSFMSPGSGVSAWNRSHHSLARQCWLIQILIERTKQSRWEFLLGKALRAKRMIQTSSLRHSPKG